MLLVEGAARSGTEGIINIWGAARIWPQNDPQKREQFYLDAYLTGAAMALQGYAVMTGAGSGIMEAANRGCMQKGGLSLGGQIINLPFQKGANPFLHESVAFDRFVTRKGAFHHANGAIIFPGGFGTMDELFELLALIGEDRTCPIVLYGREYWEGLVEWMSKTPSLVNVLKGIKRADNPNEAVKMVLANRYDPARALTEEDRSSLLNQLYYDLARGLTMGKDRIGGGIVSAATPRFIDSVWDAAVLEFKQLFEEIQEGEELLANQKPLAVACLGSATERSTELRELALGVGDELARQGLPIMTDGRGGLESIVRYGIYRQGGKSIICGAVPYDFPGTNLAVPMDHPSAAEIIRTRHTRGLIILSPDITSLAYGMEVLNLRQTGKITDYPIVLIGTKAWGPFLKWADPYPDRSRLVTKSRDGKEPDPLLVCTDNIQDAVRCMRDRDFFRQQAQSFLANTLRRSLGVNLRDYSL
ncbi:MAG: LOG family protein [Candidatus Dormibacteraceae bacterium]